MSAPALPAWSVHLPTAGATVVRLALRARGPRDPWPFMEAITELGRLGARATEQRFRSVGAGRGHPLIASQELAWRGLPLHFETVALGSAGGQTEASLELPSWDELVAAPDATEEALWDLVDTLAAVTGAVYGAIGDGEALAAPPDLAHHAALLVSAAGAGAAGWHAADYRELPLSGLHVLLR